MHRLMDARVFGMLTISLRRELRKKKMLTLSDTFDERNNSALSAKVTHILKAAQSFFPDHTEFFSDMLRSWTGSRHKSFGSAIEAIDYMAEIMKLETEYQTNITERKIFEGVQDKLEEAAQALNRDDTKSTMSNLNTALELIQGLCRNRPRPPMTKAHRDENL